MEFFERQIFPNLIFQTILHVTVGLKSRHE